MKARIAHIYKLSLSAFLCGETPFRLLNRLGRRYVRAHDGMGGKRLLKLDSILGIYVRFGTPERLDNGLNSDLERYGFWNFEAPEYLSEHGLIGRLYIL